MRKILFRLKGQKGFERRRIEWYYSKEPSDEDFMPQNISGTCEVIGNTYDNPELLEENK